MKVKIMIFLFVTAIFSIASLTSAETYTVDLPELVGLYDENDTSKTATFDFETTFIQIDEVRISMNGTFTPGTAHGDGIWNPIDELIDLPPEIHLYMDPGIGSCFTFMHPSESPFDIEEIFEIKFGATWDFLLDGTDEVNAELGVGGGIGWVIETWPTFDVSEAYLTFEGIIPEPSTFLLLLFGALGIRPTNRIKKMQNS